MVVSRVIAFWVFFFRGFYHIIGSRRAFVFYVSCMNVQEGCKQYKKQQMRFLQRITPTGAVLHHEK